MPSLKQVDSRPTTSFPKDRPASSQDEPPSDLDWMLSNGPRYGDQCLGRPRPNGRGGISPAFL